MCGVCSTFCIWPWTIRVQFSTTLNINKYGKAPIPNQPSLGSSAFIKTGQKIEVKKMTNSKLDMFQTSQNVYKSLDIESVWVFTNL